MRQSSILRTTSETHIELEFGLDGSGKSTIETGIGFFDHMLTLFTRHGLFNLTLKADGDTQVDFHHTVEDVGICLGLAFRESIGNAAGIRRYSSGLIPMDEALAEIAIDVSNRPFLSFNADFPKAKIGEFDVELVEEFWRAFVMNARITAHIRVVAGTNLHHIAEGIFKGMGVLLDEATSIDPRKSEQVPSTKGIL
ncbi:imidazoleglycerol-phosphate dehydratase HisB [bacterium]|nr:imidazoleglycerol-phosphate dehydratase HisB [bacterium]